MKVTFNVECSPEEARAFLGLPDVAPMQQALMADLEQRLRSNIDAMTPDAMLKTWLPASLQNVEQAQKMFWSQMQQTMTGIATTTTGAMNAFAERPIEVMLFAETERLYLRALEKSELPRMVELLNVWDIVRWLAVVPFPYTMRDAQEFYADMAACYDQSEPQLFILAQKTDNLLIGAVGLHPPRTADPEPGEIEIGYWLAQDHWGKRFVSEAVRAVMKIGFARPTTEMIGATTAENNIASQKVLCKAGLRNMGVVPRTYSALRGENQVVRWLITRAEYEQGSTT